MKRSGFKVQRPPGSRPLRAAKQIGDEYTLRPREVAAAVNAGHRHRPPVAKFGYVRDEAFRDMCRGMACKRCGAAGEAAGVTWAHSNLSIHGKGKGIKASDEFVAALCWRCHGLLDQGGGWDALEKATIWHAAYRLTVAMAVQLGTWPKGYAVPVFESDEVIA